MADRLDLVYRDDDIPWCGLFAGHCVGASLPDEVLPTVVLRARAWLLAVDQAVGVSTLDLLKDGRFDEAIRRVVGAPSPGAHRILLSRAARDARRPKAPALLLGAEQERPDVPAKARAVHARQTPRTTG